jgi:hypothetical protein
LLPKFAYLTEEVGLDRRGAARRTINLLSIPPGGSPVKRIVLLDLSQTGLRFHSLATLDLGETVIVFLPHAGKVEAKVVWRQADEYGAKFEGPLTSGAVSAAILASPPRIGPAPSMATAPSELRPIRMVYVHIALWSLLMAVAGLIAALALLPVSGF